MYAATMRAVTEHEALTHAAGRPALWPVSAGFAPASAAPAVNAAPVGGVYSLVGAMADQRS